MIQPCYYSHQGIKPRPGQLKAHADLRIEPENMPTEVRDVCAYHRDRAIDSLRWKHKVDIIIRWRN